MRLPAWITPTRVALFCVVLVAIALRFSHLGAWPPGLYPDEATEGNDALAALHGHASWFYEANNGREGLYANLQAVLLWLIGLREPWVLRLTSAIAGILTIPGMYLLGRELWNRRTGLIAAALLAGSFWHVVFSRVGFRAILAPLVLVYALAALLAGARLLRDDKKAGWWWMGIGGALAGAGLHTYIAFRAAALVFIATGLALLRPARLRSRMLKGLVVAGVCAFVVAAPLLQYFVTHPGSFGGRSSQVSVFSQPHPWNAIARNIALETGMLVWQGDANWRHNDSGEPEVLLVTFLFAVAGFALVCRQLHAKGKGDIPGMTLVALLVAGFLPAVLSDEGMPHALRGIMLVVPVFLLAAYGLERFWEQMEIRGAGRAGAVLVFAVCAYGMLFTALAYPLYAMRSEVRAEFTWRYLQVGRELLRRDLDRPAYVVVPEGDVLVNGIPVAAQTPMFISGTATRAEQERERVFYVTSTARMPQGAAVYDMRR